LQTIVSYVFNTFEINDVNARSVAVSFGIAIVFLTYLIGRELYNKRVAAIAALIVAVLPFHVMFTRQIMVDVPLAFFFTLTLYLIIKYKQTNRIWLCYWIGVTSGLSFLSKELGFIVLLTSLSYLFLIKRINIRRTIVIFLGFLLAISPYFLLIIFRQEAAQAFGSYLSWQFSRNYVSAWFYPNLLVEDALGYALTGLCLIALFLGYRIKAREYREPLILLLLWLVIVLVFYQIVPVKEERFLLPIIPVCAILGASVFFLNLKTSSLLYNALGIGTVAIIILSTNFFIGKFFPIDTTDSLKFGGKPYMREAALWIKDNTPSNSSIVTNSILLDDIIKFYANRNAYRLSSQNPADLKIESVGLMLTNKEIKYYAHNLDRDTAFDDPSKRASNMLKMVKYLNGSLVHTEYQEINNNGTKKIIPAIQVYEFKE
jgi:4-amino-4-deoxy-L-arabinose transferase-like glycosyltransferase